MKRKVYLFLMLSILTFILACKKDSLVSDNNYYFKYEVNGNVLDNIIIGRGSPYIDFKKYIINYKYKDTIINGKRWKPTEEKILDYLLNKRIYNIDGFQFGFSQFGNVKHMDSILTSLQYPSIQLLSGQCPTNNLINENITLSNPFQFYYIVHNNLKLNESYLTINSYKFIKKDYDQFLGNSTRIFEIEGKFNIFINEFWENNDSYSWEMKNGKFKDLFYLK